MLQKVNHKGFSKNRGLRLPFLFCDEYSLTNVRYTIDIQVLHILYFPIETPNYMKFNLKLNYMKFNFPYIKIN